jgi:hypothetical protein
MSSNNDESFKRIYIPFLLKFPYKKNESTKSLSLILVLNINKTQEEKK